MDKVKELINQNFVNTAVMLHKTGNYSTLVPYDGRWSKQPPESPKGTIMITISNWTHEQTKVNKGGITITTAFGDVESTAFFKWEEVLGLFTEDLDPLLVRSFKVESKRISIYKLIRRN